MKNFSLDLKFFKVGEHSTYEGLLEVLSKEPMIYINGTIAKVSIIDESILFMLGSDTGIYLFLNKGNFSIEEVGRSYEIKFRADYGLSSAELSFSDLTVIESNIDMIRSEFQKYFSPELIRRFKYEAKISDEIETIK